MTWKGDVSIQRRLPFTFVSVLGPTNRVSKRRPDWVADVDGQDFDTCSRRRGEAVEDCMVVVGDLRCTENWINMKFLSHFKKNMKK